MTLPADFGPLSQTPRWANSISGGIALMVSRLAVSVPPAVGTPSQSASVQPARRFPAIAGFAANGLEHVIVGNATGIVGGLDEIGASTGQLTRVVDNLRALT